MSCFYFRRVFEGVSFLRGAGLFLQSHLLPGGTSEWWRNTAAPCGCFVLSGVEAAALSKERLTLASARHGVVTSQTILESPTATRLRRKIRVVTYTTRVPPPPPRARRLQHKTAVVPAAIGAYRCSTTENYCAPGFALL